MCKGRPESPENTALGWAVPRRPSRDPYTPCATQAMPCHIRKEAVTCGLVRGHLGRLFVVLALRPPAKALRGVCRAGAQTLSAVAILQVQQAVRLKVFGKADCWQTRLDSVVLTGMRIQHKSQPSTRHQPPRPSPRSSF